MLAVAVTVTETETVTDAEALGDIEGLAVGVLVGWADPRYSWSICPAFRAVFHSMISSSRP